MKWESFFNRMLVWCAGIILLFLTFMSVLFTQRVGKERLNEIVNNAPIYEVPDRLIFHVLAVSFVVGLGIMLNGLKVNIKFIQGGTSVIAFALSLIILQGGTRTPVDDQIQVCSAASLFNQGIYVNLAEGGYLNIYPHQLGLVQFLQGIFLFCGDLNYEAIYIINALFISAAIYVLSWCMYELSKNSYVVWLGCLIILLTLPLFLLSTWAYGDVPSFFFVSVFICSFIRFMKYKRNRDIFLMCMSILFACVVRKNSIIVAIAATVVFTICSIFRKKAKYFVVAMMLLLLPLMGIKGIQQHYENVSGYEIDGGIPNIMYIAMGMMDAGSKPGWFSNYHVSTYYSVSCDRELAEKHAEEEIIKRINFFCEDPIAAISFYKRKICTQWNDPFYNTERLIKTDAMDTISGISKFLYLKEDGIRIFFVHCSDANVYGNVNILY